MYLLEKLYGIPHYMATPYYSYLYIEDSIIFIRDYLVFIYNTRQSPYGFPLGTSWTTMIISISFFYFHFGFLFTWFSRCESSHVIKKIQFSNCFFFEIYHTRMINIVILEWSKKMLLSLCIKHYQSCKSTYNPEIMSHTTFNCPTKNLDGLTVLF